MRIKATYIPQKWHPSDATELKEGGFEDDIDKTTQVIIVAILPSSDGRIAEAIAIPSNGECFIQDSIRHFRDIEWPKE